MQLEHVEEVLDQQVAKMAVEGGLAPACGHPECDQATKSVDEETQRMLNVIFGELELTHGQRLLILMGFSDVLDKLHEVVTEVGLREDLHGMMDRALGMCADSIVKDRYRELHEKL